MRRRQHITTSRRCIGAVAAWLPGATAKRLILRARELGLLRDTDTEALIAERGLKGA